MNLLFLWRTIRYLRMRQIVYQILYGHYKPRYEVIKVSSLASKLSMCEVIRKPESYQDMAFTFLNQTVPFQSWNYTEQGMLWAYNLNYMDWLIQPNMTLEKGEWWIDQFIAELPRNKVGLDPYPIALRGINWIKFISMYEDAIPAEKQKVWNDSLYSQYRLLNRKLEYHLLGNHLLEDAYSLYIAAIYFADKTFYKKGVRLLRQELSEQILPDGAHYEQSPMYHCILLDRLLDCCNISLNNIRFDGQMSFNDFLKEQAIRMLGHLESIIYSDQSIPLLNDSAVGIAPSPEQLFHYAKRLGLEWGNIQMKECGYRKFTNSKIEAVVDVGNMTASYQPGHSHADTFHYELRIGGKPFIIDTGISTYNKTVRRQLERSTVAHNTVTLNEKDSSEIWSGFRVGNRAKVTILEDMPHKITATHDGFGRTALHQRTFELSSVSFEITDHLTQPAHCKSYIHFAPGVQLLSCTNGRIDTDSASIYIDGANQVEVIPGKVSSEYNQLLHNEIVVIHFSKELKYQIVIK